MSPDAESFGWNADEHLREFIERGQKAQEAVDKIVDDQEALAVWRKAVADRETVMGFSEWLAWREQEGT